MMKDLLAKFEHAICKNNVVKTCNSLGEEKVQHLQEDVHLQLGVVGELLDSVRSGGVVLEEDGHLESWRLWRQQRFDVRKIHDLIFIKYEGERCRRYIDIFYVLPKPTKPLKKETRYFRSDIFIVSLRVCLPLCAIDEMPLGAFALFLCVIHIPLHFLHEVELANKLTQGYESDRYFKISFSSILLQWKISLKLHLLQNQLLMNSQQQLSIEVNVYLKSVAVFEAVGNDLPLWHLIQPGQFPACMLLRVESCETLVAFLKLRNKQKRKGWFLRKKPVLYYSDELEHPFKWSLPPAFCSMFPQRCACAVPPDDHLRMRSATRWPFAHA